MKYDSFSTLLKILILIVLPFFGFSQTITIVGKVKDSQTKEGLPSCNLFINNSTIGTNTDLDGNFRLSNVSLKEFELIFTYIGYVSFSKKIIAKDGETITLDIELKPSDNALSEIEVKSKRDKKWEKQLKRFKNSFLGFSDFAEKCEIENAWVIDFEENGEGFKAKASQPIKIINSALGYDISFELIEFSVSKESYRIGGNVRFTELVPVNKAKLEEWFANRAIAYKKSPTYLFKSLIDEQLVENGFALYAAKPGSSSVRTDDFDSELGKSIVAYDAKAMVSLGNRPEFKKIYIKDNLEVHNQSVKTDLRTYRDLESAVSWMQVRGNNVYVDNRGVAINHRDIVVSGDMDYLKVSGFLPLDFDPKSSANEAYFLKFEKPAFTETVHLHTDRVAYYPGDKIWYKAYLNYSSFVQDTVSNVLYVQLINSNKEILETQKLEISNGFAYGNLSIPPDLPKGIYQIRSFTNYMRNFDQKLCQSYFSVLDKNERYESSVVEIRESERIKVKLERIADDKLVFLFLDQNERPIAANFSISVTNPNYSPEILISDISKDLSLKDIKNVRNFPFEKEKGLSFGGLYFDKKKTPIQGEFTLFVNNLHNFSQSFSDVNGKIEFKNLHFYGETDLYLQAVSKKHKEGIFVTINQDTFPVVSFASPTITSKVLKTENDLFAEIQQTVATDTLQKKKAAENTQKMIYGRPDYVILEKDINKLAGTLGVVNSILKKVPNIQYRGGVFIIRGGTSSIFNSQAALVLIDGVPMGSLASVEPNNISKIEVVAGMSNMFGDLGRNGIISIFLKDKNSYSDDMMGKDFTKIPVIGYVIPEVFSQQKIKMTSGEDIPTVYWNPEVISDASGKAELMLKVKGESKVTIEGITQNNVPFRKVFYLK